MNAYIVLGGRGYIGAPLVQRLQVEGRRPILVADVASGNGSDGVLAPFDSATFATAARPQGLRLDVTDPYATLAAFAAVRDAWPRRLVVLHLAGLFAKRPEERASTPDEEYRRQNMGGARTVVDALNAIGGPSLLVFQSAGGLERFPDEIPPDPYLRSKLEAEELVKADCGGDWVILRPMRVLGTAGELLSPRRLKGPLLDGLRAARDAGRVPTDVLTSLVLDAEVVEGTRNIVLPAANSQVAYVHLHDAVTALCWAASPRTPSRRTFRVTTFPAVTFTDIGRVLVEELRWMGVEATTVEHVSDTPILLSPPLSAEFPWVPSLRTSKDVVRAATWQYLEAAREEGRRLLAHAATAGAGGERSLHQ
jgi:nucleoside-diphosphate-sugar epimerase